MLEILRTAYGFLFLSLACVAASANQRPNILWITSEDNSPLLGSYGDPHAQMPNLDALASKGVRYTNCFANAPVCAPARNSWIFGVPAATMGTLNMRSNHHVPRDVFKTYAELLKEAGYYVTNNRKTDYNTHSVDPDVVWHESSGDAHYRNAPDGMPFFAVFNSTLSHESRIFPERRPQRTRDWGAEIELPPYQYSSPEAIQDWQMYYECLTRLDDWVGEILKELEALGKAEDTIVVYNSDHGGVTLRSKRFLHDSGTRVPLIVYVPEKWQHLSPASPGTTLERLVQFIDMPKTWLSLAGIEPPQVMPGRVFLGETIEPAPDWIYLFSGRLDEAPDNSRAVTDGRWKYIRNFEPDRPRYQLLSFPLRQEGQQAQLAAYQAGETNDLQSAFYENQPPEELYDTLNDPHEVNNLAATETEQLKLMRAELRKQILASHDLGLMPEPLMERMDASGVTTLYEFAQIDNNYPLERILDTAIMASDRKVDNVEPLIAALADDNATVRYWAALGLRVLADQAAVAKPALEVALSDSEPSVRITAAVALGRQGQRERAVRFLLNEAKTAEYDKEALWALDGLKLLNASNPFKGMQTDEMAAYNKGSYSSRLVERFTAIALEDE